MQTSHAQSGVQTHDPSTPTFGGRGQGLVCMTQFLYRKCTLFIVSVHTNVSVVALQKDMYTNKRKF